MICLILHLTDLIWHRHAITVNEPYYKTSYFNKDNVYCCTTPGLYKNGNVPLKTKNQI